MKTNNNRFFEAMLCLIQLVPLIYLAFTWNSYPDRVPTHWNFDGVADNWGGRWALFIGPGTGLFVYLLLRFIPLIDPKRASFLQSAKAWNATRLAIQVFLLLISMVALIASQGNKIDVGIFVQIGVLLLLLVLGNYMHSIKHNYFFGVRTPWTLASEEVWKHTHRFTSRLWVFATIPMIAVAAIWPKAGWPLMVYIVIISIVPIVYSYLLFRKTNSQQ